MTGILDARPKVGYFYSGITGATLVGNKIKDKNGFARNRVSRFNNLHYSSDFYKKLSNLLDLVKEYEEVENANW